MTVMLLEWVCTSLFLILSVLALRALFGRRVSARLRYMLWAVVLARLLVPVQLFTSPLAGTRVFTGTQAELSVSVPENRPAAPAVTDDVLSLGEQAGPSVTLSSVPQAPALPDAPEPPDFNNPPNWLGGLGWAWLGGSAAMALVLTASNLRFARRLRRCRIPMDGADCPLPVYAAVGLPSPCLFGLIRPAVYVPPEAAANPAMLRHVIAHEYTHFRHADHLWSFLRCAALAAHWWNPLVWLAVRLSRQDGELACDEGALKRLGDGERLAYGNTLLALVTSKPGPGELLCFATTMAGDKKSLKERVSRIARAPKRWLWAALAVVLVTVLACVCAFGQAAEPEDTPDDFWPDDAACLVFVRDEGGFGGDFTICLNQDGSFTYYAGLFSSYFGMGTWTRDGDVICLADEGLKDSAGIQRFYFREDGVDLIFLAENSAKFMYVDVADGERFSRKSSELELPKFDPVRTAPQDVEVEIGFSTAVPADVLNAAKKYVAQQFQTDVPDGWVKEWGFSYDEEKEDWVPVPLQNPVPFDRVRIKSMTDAGSETLYGMGETVQVELWEFLYEYHTTEPELAEILLVGGMTLDGDGWMCFDNGCNYLAVATREGGKTITPFQSQADRSSVGFRNDLLNAMEEVGVETATRYQNAALLYDDNGNARAFDLNRNGVEEYIQTCEFYYTGESESQGPQGQRVEVWEGDTLIWSDEGYNAHAGYNAVFLCTLDGEEYLLRYHPNMAQGWCAYSYELFTLTKDGKETVVRENSVEFDINFGPMHESFDPETIAAFMDEVNGLLANSVQLINTDADLLGTFQEEGRLYDWLWWMEIFGFTPDKTKTMLENLRDYQLYME